MEPAPAPAAPYVRIVEQPASKALRFRYQCEGRSAGSIPGVSSTADKKTFPTIEIVGHKGRAIVVVSCVTKDPPYRPHPHNLVGRDRCNKGVCTVKPDVGESPLVSFSNLGIQCVKRKDVEEALDTREELNVDPFKTGYEHKKQPQSIDLNAVRLCFQVFLPDARSGKYRHSLPPVVSDVIYDKKAMSDLQIMRVSRCSGSVRGDTEIILLCEKVTREDIAVVFLQKDASGAVVWEAAATVLLVHKQFAIDFKTPPYRDPAATEHVHVFFQLKRPSDNARSEALPFEYLPAAADQEYLKTKRRKTMSPYMNNYEHDRGFVEQKPPIKAEPRERSPPLGGAYAGDPAPSHYQQWLMQQAQSNQAMSWQPYNVPLPGMATLQPSPGMQVPGLQSLPPLSPGLHGLAPGLPALSPMQPAMSPNMQQMSPNVHQMGHGGMSPNVHQMGHGGLSPNVHQMGHGGMSPNMHQMGPGGVSPQLHAMSPAHGAVSPPYGAVSPPYGAPHLSPAMDPMAQNLGHISPNLVQPNMNQVEQAQLMDTGASDPPSITGLLLDRGDGLQLNSADLSSLLGDRGNDLSDSLRGLSTSDLLK